VPLYEYECTKCHKRTEKIERASGPHLKKCPHCGGKVEQVLAPPAILFKGSGWYVTDYAGKKSGENAASASSDGGSKETSKEAKDTPAKETKEKKPAKK
jgi:putative FmdB family regulatory protein